MMKQVIILVWLHFFADFMFQTDKMAINKSKSNAWLAAHVATYAFPFFLYFNLKYALINSIAHFFTDWVTSRITTTLWRKNNRHWFFVTIGADQAIHITTLILTLEYLK